ncbi:MAG: tetratricopeptide repeat protein [Planctomycetota bacterium]
MGHEHDHEHDHDHHGDEHGYEDGDEHGYADDHDHDEPPSPEEELASARELLGEGELEHAMQHLVGAVGELPDDPEVLGLVDELASAWEGDPLELVPLEGGAYFGAVAVHAHLLARAGRFDDAVSLLCQVIAVRPDRPFVAWLETWLGLPGVLERVDPERLASSCERCLMSLRHRAELEDHRARLLTLARAARVHHPDDALLGYFLAVNLRRAGQVEEAEALAREACARTPSYFSHVALAGSLRERGDLEGAIDSFEAALRHEPDDLSVRLDVGDLRLELGQLEPALAAYEQVTAREPGHPWAAPSACYVHLLLDGDPTWEERLAELAEEEGRALDLYDRVAPYRRALRPPGSSLIDATSQALEQGYALTDVAVSGLEPPSVRLAMDWAFRLAGEATPGVSTGDVPEPDPRRPTAEVDHLLWRYEGTDPAPALPPPSERVAGLVAALAGADYDPTEWGALALELAKDLGPAAAPELLAAMVHPYEDGRLEGVPPWEWLFRVQVAAAFIVARLDAGWEGSARRAALRALLHGPLDWTTTAALVAVTQLAQEEPALAPSLLGELLPWLDAPPSPIQWMSAGEPLRHLLPRFPGLDPALGQRLEAERLALLREEASPNQ